jgi:VWFA-related protein
MRLFFSIRRLSVAGLVAFAAAAMSGQTTQPEPGARQGSVAGSAANEGQVTPQPTIRTGANLVLVDVVATDHDRPVLGLDRSLFHVFEDGKEQPISSFDEHQPAPALPAFMTSALPANTYTNLPAYPPSSAVNVLLLDALNTPWQDQQRVRQKMIDYLGTVKPGTSLAIFTLGSRLRVVTEFTNDPGSLVRAFKNPKTNPQQSILLNTQQSADLSTMQVNAVASSQPAQPANGSGAPSNPAEGLSNRPGQAVGPVGAVAALQQFQADQSAAQIGARVKITLSAMRELASYLGGIDGRKNVIWFSGSFPFVIFPDASVFNSFGDVTSFREEVQKTADMLTAARVAVYPVDARGIMPPSEFSASTPFVVPDGVRGTQITIDQEELHSEETTMQVIADETGGHAYLNDNDLDKAVANAVENGSSYYTIAYVPPSEHLDGKYHKIQVRTDGERGIKLAYRHGYYADATGMSAGDHGGPSSLFAATIAHDAPAATQILLRARVLPAGDPLLQGVSVPGGPAGEMLLKGAAHRYVIDLTLDAHGLTFNTGTDGSHRAALELAMVAYDGEGRQLNFYQHAFQLGVKDSQIEHIMAAGISLRIPFDLPGGKVYLRIGVHDLNADRAGSLEVPLLIAQP